MPPSESMAHPVSKHVPAKPAKADPYMGYQGRPTMGRVRTEMNSRTDDSNDDELPADDGERIPTLNGS